jgi:acetoin utilization deacetylase AcuC-like enzyme
MATGLFSHPDCNLHDMGDWHPECPGRLQAIEDQLIASRIEPLLVHEEAPLVDEAELLRVHHADHLEFIRALAPEAGYAEIDADTRMNPHSWRAAMRAAGAAVAATDAVIDGRYDNAFCSVRPPGHHAEPGRAMGFCLFNNIAVAARHALDVRGLSRVAVVDFDVHHGNGTEAVFAGDERVLMCSFFQHPFYPYSGGESRASNMVNVPLAARTNGATMREAVDMMWMPALEAFRPEMIFVSAGFDAHREDDLGGLALVEADYEWLTAQICAIAKRYAQGRIVSCLEGGYNLSALGRSVASHLKILTEA